MSILIGGGLNIAVPFPTVFSGRKMNSTIAGAYRYPHPVNDGSSIVYTPSSKLEISNAANSVLYTILPTNINASATLITAMWLDTVDGVIYVLASNAIAGHGYIAKVNYSTGVVTAVGTGFIGPTNAIASGSAPLRMERAAMGAGDLTIWGFTSSNMYKVSVSSTTGLVTVAESIETSNSAPIAQAYTYETLDRTIYCRLIPNQATAGIILAQQVGMISMQRNGYASQIAFDASALGGIGALNDSALMRQWGVDMLTISDQTASLNGTQNYTRSSFDSWLQRMADTAGFP